MNDAPICVTCYDGICEEEGCDRPDRCGCERTHPEAAGAGEPVVARPAPLDHLPKQEGRQPVTFTVDGKTWEIPALTPDMPDKVPGGVFRRFMRDPSNELAASAFAFHVAEVALADVPGALEALDSLPAGEMSGIVREWFTGEPQRSSD